MWWEKQGMDGVTWGAVSCRSPWRCGTARGFPGWTTSKDPAPSFLPAVWRAGGKDEPQVYLHHPCGGHRGLRIPRLHQGVWNYILAVDGKELSEAWRYCLGAVGQLVLYMLRFREENTAEAADLVLRFARVQPKVRDVTLVGELVLSRSRSSACCRRKEVYR